MSESEQTPVDRPARVSDLNKMRKEIRHLTQTVVDGYEEAKLTRREPRMLTAACLIMTLVTVGAALTSLSARDAAVKAAHAATVRP